VGPLSYKQFILMMPVQIHLSHFSPGSLTHVVVVLMLLSGLTLRDMGIHVTHFYNQLLQLGSNIVPQWGSPDGSASALPVVPFPLL